MLVLLLLFLFFSPTVPEIQTDRGTSVLTRPASDIRLSVEKLSKVKRSHFVTSCKPKKTCHFHLCVCLCVCVEGVRLIKIFHLYAELFN